MPDLPIFKDLCVEMRNVYDKYYRLSQTYITDLTFNCRYAWDNVFCDKYAIIEDCLVIISNGGCFTHPHMLMPLGNLDDDKLARIIEQVIPIFEDRGWALRIMGIDEDKIDLFDRLGYEKVSFCFSNNNSDYLYDAEALRTLSTNELRKKRTHFNRFLRLYPNYEYQSITQNDMSDCLRLVETWSTEKGIDVTDVKKSDYLMIKRLFKDFGDLDVRGGVIRIDGKVAAFSMGSFGNHDTAYIHFEKADVSYDGAYPAINKLVIENAYPEAKFVNREEDLGMPGLRKSKRSYYPIRMIKKYGCQIVI